jgi:hypothetical protein
LKAALVLGLFLFSKMKNLKGFFKDRTGKYSPKRCIGIIAGILSILMHSTLFIQGILHPEVILPNLQVLLESANNLLIASATLLASTALEHQQKIL